MASIKKLATLQKRIYLANLKSSNSEFITLLINGPHGRGKSQVAKQTAVDMGGKCYTIECSTLGMGELTGLPFSFSNPDGSRELRYIPHWVINRIKQLQKFYYEKAKSKGFLNGRIKIVEKDDKTYLVDGEKEYQMMDQIDLIAASEENMYEFGGQLDFKTKLELLESGEIKPVFINMDEINRCELQTMKEIMNFILNRSINGYQLPWWVSIIASQNPNSQNSTYATNEMDDAQLSRFLKINIDTNFDDWVNYAMSNKLNVEIVEALANLEGGNIFASTNKGMEDTQHMTPDPRAWEMICNLYDTLYESNSTKYFNADEKQEVDEDFRILVRGKVGDEAARSMFQSLNQAKSFIKAKDLITGKDQKIAKEVLEKFLGCKKLMQYIISRSVCNYVANNYEQIISGKTSTDAKKKALYMNYIGQISHFVNSLDASTQIEFIKNLRNLENGTKMYMEISVGFAKETLNNIVSAQTEIRNVNESSRK